MERAAWRRADHARRLAGNRLEPFLSESSRARLFMRPSVYGCRGSSKSAWTSHSSTTRPAYMTTTRSASSAIKPRSWVMRMIAACVSLGRLDHLHDLSLDRHVERRRRLVGDEHRRRVGDRHGDHPALPHASRELVRVLAVALLGIGDADEREQVDDPPLGFVLFHAGLWARIASAICGPTVSTG